MELRTEIEILAPPERVWRALTDFGAYHEWNPFITSVSGQLDVGGELEVSLSPPESEERRVRAKVLVRDEPGELCWLERRFLPGVFDCEHFFRCSGTDAGHTRLVHGGNFRGLLLRFSGEQLKQLARGFVYMNEALKRRVEGGGRRVASS